MALFTKRDRIAIACIATLVLIGWGIRLALYRSGEVDDIRIIRNAIKLPASLDTLSVEFEDIFSPVDINNAGASELEILPMIGPVRAAAIIEYREKHGPFNKTEDVTKVPGIGPATYEKIKKQIKAGSGEGLEE